MKAPQEKELPPGHWVSLQNCKGRSIYFVNVYKKLMAEESLGMLLGLCFDYVLHHSLSLERKGPSYENTIHPQQVASLRLMEMSHLVKEPLQEGQY